MNYKRKESVNAGLGGSTSGMNYDIIRGAERNDLDEVRSAVEIEGVSVNYQEPVAGLTALHKVAARGNILVLKWLVSHPDVDLDIRDTFDRSAAKVAAMFRQEEAYQIICAARFSGD